MTDNNSQWLSIFFLFLSIPLGILTNIITPKFQLWLALWSKKSLRKQIEKAEKTVKLIDRMIKEPSFAIAKFSNTLLRALMGYIGISLFFTFIIVVSNNPNIFTSPPPKDLPQADTVRTILNAVYVFLPSFILIINTSRKTIELYAMTYWIEENAKWKQEKIKEIERLKKKLAEHAT